MILKEIDSSFNFKNFKTTKYNIFSKSAAEVFCEGEYSILVICGPQKCGKTHLVNAIANSMLHRDKRIHYVEMESLCNEIVKTAKTDKIINEYIDCDVLILEDLQNIYEDSNVQEIVNDIIRTAYDNDVKIAITTNIKPFDMHLSPLLLDVLDWGIIVTLAGM